MNFPTLKGDENALPKNELCPVCLKNQVFKAHSMVILSGGALLMDRKENSGGPSDDLDGFLDIAYHSSSQGEEKNDRDLFVVTEMAQDCKGGQFEIYFCSTSCLRSYLNGWVDKLEDDIKTERSNQTVEPSGVPPLAHG